MATAYDLVRYPNPPIPETHPARLAAIAALCGRTSAPAEACRVLELGAGNGTNLMSMAAGLPGSEFVGIDLAAAPIALGRTIAEAAGLTNVTLLARDITADPSDLGRFDYIVAHGVYAWVPQPVRQALTRLVSAALTPAGLAYVSYNVQPGCRLRQALRDIMREAGRGLADPAAAVEAAFAALRLQITGWSDEKPFQSALKTEATKLLRRAPAELFHDELNADYAPQLFTDVVTAARETGLDYLCDTFPGLLAEAAFPSETFEAARPVTGGDWVRFEQMLDFNGMRRFRRSLFVRVGDAIDRRFRPVRLAGLHAAGQIRIVEPDPDPAGASTFVAANGTEFTTADPDLVALMRDLASAWPRTVPLSRFADREAVLEAVGRMFVAEMVLLGASPVAVATAPGPRPVASHLARAQVACGETDVSSLLHRGVTLDDAATRDFLRLLDGSRTHEDLARHMAAATGCGIDQSRSRGEATLRNLGQMGLLVA